MLLLQPTIAQPIIADITMVGVSDGDSFTYVLEEYQDSFGPYSLAYNWTSNTGLEIAVGDEFTITVTNATVSTSYGPLEIGVRYSNGTQTVDDTAIFLFYALFGGNGWIMFTEWAFYEVSLTGQLQNSKDVEDINSYEVINSEKEFFWSTKGSEEDPDAFTETIHDKITGMLLYASWDYTIFGSRSYGTLRQKDYANFNGTVTEKFSFPGFQSTTFILALFAIITVLFATIIVLRRKKYL